MKKKLLTVILAALLVFSFSACSAIEDAMSSLGGGNGDRQEHSAKVGQKHSTVFFDFKVDSVASITEYNGYAAPEGYQLVDVVITTTNTFGKDLEMYDNDFELWWGSRDDDDAYAFPLSAFDDTMAPSTHDLADGDTMTFHYVFEVPDDITEFELFYIDAIVYEDGEEDYGDMYFVPFKI